MKPHQPLRKAIINMLQELLEIVGERRAFVDTIARWITRIEGDAEWGTTAESTIEFVDMLGNELCEHGFTTTWEPTAIGSKIEDIISYIIARETGAEPRS